MMGACLSVMPSCVTDTGRCADSTDAMQDDLIFVACVCACAAPHAGCSAFLLYDTCAYLCCATCMQVSEIVMLRNGCDVCCTSDTDKERVIRVDEMIKSLGSSSSTDQA